MVTLPTTDYSAASIKHSIPALVEVPTVWLKSKRDGDRNRLMFDQLKKSLCRHKLDVTFEPISLGKSFKVRSAPASGFTLSYHSIGYSPHVWRIKETPIQYFYSFDRFGFSGWSDLALRPDYYRGLIASVNPLQAANFTVNLRKKLVESNSSKYEQNEAPFNIDVPFIFYPLQIRGDIVAKLNRIDAFEVLLKAASLAKKHRTMLVVKRHPYCRNPWVSWALCKAKFNNPYIMITSASIHKILPICSKVLVANSGVGFEALVHGKQTYSFGGSEYELATHQLHSLEEIETLFNEQSEIDPSWIDKFVYYFLNECCFDSRNSNDIDIKLQKAISNIHEKWPDIKIKY